MSNKKLSVRFDFDEEEGIWWPRIAYGSKRYTDHAFSTFIAGEEQPSDGSVRYNVFLPNEEIQYLTLRQAKRKLRRELKKMVAKRRS